MPIVYAYYLCGIDIGLEERGGVGQSKRPVRTKILASKVIIKIIIIIILEPSVFLELNYHEIVQDYYFFIQYLLETAYNSVL